MSRRFVIAFLAVCVSALVLVESAEARYMPFSTGYRAIYRDIWRAEREVNWENDSGLGNCGRYVLSRLECQVWLKGDELYEYVPGNSDLENPEPGRFIHLHHRCDWVAVAHWRFKRVVVKRRELTCEQWFDESPTQP